MIMSLTPKLTFASLSTVWSQGRAVKPEIQIRTKQMHKEDAELGVAAHLEV